MATALDQSMGREFPEASERGVVSGSFVLGWGLNPLLIAALASLVCSGAPVTADMEPGEQTGSCSGPTGHEPGAPKDGCQWNYLGYNEVFWDDVDGPHVVTKHGSWVTVPYCFCGWYPSTVPCPTCPDESTTETVTDTVSWSVQTTSEDSNGLAVKATIFSELGVQYNQSWKESETRAISGTHTETTTITRPYRKAACFTNYIRPQWDETTVKVERHITHTYNWQQECDHNPYGDVMTTQCKQYIEGEGTYHTFPLYETAPSQPPCGGVAIGPQDPWDGKRAEPCCPDVCTPPPSPDHPCCGCEVHN